MEVLPSLLLLTLCVMGSASADPVMFRAGTGTPNPGQGDSRAIWSEPPDLNGTIWSCEQILEFGYESELANDFIPTETRLTHVTWWGGFMDLQTPCDPGIPTPGFNLEFFETDGCFPGQMITNIVTTDFTEESVGCQIGMYPLYKWGADVALDLHPGNRYWFCPEMVDHPYPPSAGRLASMQIVECPSVFRTAYYGYPYWTIACDLGWCFEGSQEFEGDHSEACCFSDGHCEFLLTGTCAADGGVAQGPGSVCDPNPCAITPTRPASWGKVKALFR